MALANKTGAVVAGSDPNDRGDVGVARIRHGDRAETRLDAVEERCPVVAVTTAVSGTRPVVTARTPAVVPTMAVACR